MDHGVQHGMKWTNFVDSTTQHCSVIVNSFLEVGSMMLLQMNVSTCAVRSSMEQGAVPFPGLAFEVRQKRVCDPGNTDSTLELCSCIFQTKSFAMMVLCRTCLSHASGLMVADSTLQ